MFSYHAQYLQLCEVQVQGKSFLFPGLFILHNIFHLLYFLNLSLKLQQKNNKKVDFHASIFICYVVYFIVLCTVLNLGAEQLLIPNVALAGSATQSSDYHHSYYFNDSDVAHYAIDGLFGTDIHSSRDRCAHTQQDYGAWWQVDLKYEFEIRKVAVTTRKNCE